MDNKLSNYRSSAPPIIGSTVINHAARVRLGLNCSEYCLLDHLSKKDERGGVADTSTVYINTGFTVKDIEGLFRSLIAKGFVYLDPKNNSYELTSKWEEGFPNIEKEFETKFWKINGKVAWPGSRAKSLSYYIKLRKKYSADFLESQRDHYFKYLELELKYRKFDRQKVMCQVFLNPANDRFLEDYKSYIAQIEEKYAPKEVIVKPVPITKQDVLNQYGKDNNQ